MTAHIGTPGLPRRRANVRKLQIRQPDNRQLPTCSTISMYKKELEKRRVAEAKLRKSVIREHALLRQKDELIRQKDILSKESEHRLLNGLQLITSLLSIQSRAAKNSEAATQLKVAANRVAVIGRVHRHLHALDHVENVEFKQYLENLCHDLSDMTWNGNSESALVVEGIALRIRSATAIPLGFVASELITNSIKHAKGRITVRLQRAVGNGYAMSVADDGPGLPDGFDPTETHGLGMKLISSLVEQIGGRLQVAQGDDGKGARFTVLFC